MTLKKTFNNFENIDKNYSQSGQDLFTLIITNGKRNGVFLDIGAHEPKFISNTFLLEEKFGWTGYLIEFNNELCEKCKNERTSTVICDNAVNVDYSDFFKKFIDYVSLDIDGYDSLSVLEKLPINLKNTGIITFEHDVYRFDTEIRESSRKILENKGFYRLCSDVCNENNPFEDWYINPKIYSVEEFKILEKNNSNWFDIIYC